VRTDDLPDYLTDADLDALGLDPADVPRRCPAAAELAARDGGRCWSRDEIAGLFDPTDSRELR
jgi:hypothetical protein